MIDRIDELNRLLLAMRSLGAGPEQHVPLGSVLSICAESVQGGLLPDHTMTVQYASFTGFIEATDDSVAFTDAGIDFLDLNPEHFYELTIEQRQVLARSQYLGGAHQHVTRKALMSFQLSSQQDHLTWSEVDDRPLDTPTWLVDHLCQLSILKRTEFGYETTPDMAAATVGFLDEPKGLTEEKLRAMLAERVAIGDIGEQLILKFERDRLASLGAVVEAHCVRRIGNVRVNAGYDVESFDGQTPTKIYDRFIEVKAAKSKSLKFFWTENEMKIAERLGDRYWIYFLGGVNTNTRTASQEPLMFQNPLVSILDNTNISKVSQGLIVESTMSGARK